MVYCMCEHRGYSWTSTLVCDDVEPQRGLHLLNEIESSSPENQLCHAEPLHGQHFI